MVTFCLRHCAAPRVPRAQPTHKQVEAGFFRVERDGQEARVPADAVQRLGVAAVELQARERQCAVAKVVGAERPAGEGCV